MSSISSGTTTTTGYVVSSDTTGALVLKTGASGTTALTIDTSQNVGIGTGSPARKLVVSNAGAQGFEFGAGVGLSSGNELLNYNRSTSLYVPSTSYASTHTFYTGTSGATLGLVLDASGSLLLGTSVKPSNAALNIGNPSSGTVPFLSLIASSNNAEIAYMQFTQDDDLLSIWNKQGFSGSGIRFGTNNTERARIDVNGNLCLGVTSAAGRLTVDSGSAGLMGSFNSTNANGGYLTFSTSSTVYGDIGTAAQVVSGGAASDFGINARGARNLVFGANNVERARITSGGNLGVGTTSPVTLLELKSSTPIITLSPSAYSSQYQTTLGTRSGAEAYLIFGNNNVNEIRAGRTATGGFLDIYTNNTVDQASASNGVLAMRLDASGNVLVGSTSFSTGGISKTVVINGASSAAVQFQLGGGLASYVYAYTSGAGFRVETSTTYPRVEMSPGGSGGVQLASAGATSWTSLSDERTKTDLVPITDAVQKVSSLRAMTGRFIKDDPEKSRSFLIAQDFVDVFPQAVTPYTEKDDDTEYLGLAYTDTIPLLVAAIKEQQALIESLTQRIAALEGTS